MSLQQICAHLPEIHEIAFTLNHLPHHEPRNNFETEDFLSGCAGIIFVLLIFALMTGIAMSG